MLPQPWLSVFEDRYGEGAHARLMALFDQPCVTFAEIALKFGVTRERVRQWHVQLLPDAPRGHARQRMCMAHRQKRRLFDDALFRAFYRHARPHVAAGRITLVRTRDGFTRQVVRLDGWAVAIKHARLHPESTRAGRSAYVLINSLRAVDYIYYQLGADDYLLVPKAALPGERTTFLDTPTSKYQCFRNTFSAVIDVDSRKRHSANDLGRDVNA